MPPFEEHPRFGGDRLENGGRHWPEAGMPAAILPAIRRGTAPARPGRSWAAVQAAARGGTPSLRSRCRGSRDRGRPKRRPRPTWRDRIAATAATSAQAAFWMASSPGSASIRRGIPERSPTSQPKPGKTRTAPIGQRSPQSAVKAGRPAGGWREPCLVRHGDGTWFRVYRQPESLNMARPAS